MCATALIFVQVVFGTQRISENERSSPAKRFLFQMRLGKHSGKDVM